MTFGNKIKALRREANMTQEQLSELLSLSPQAVSRWETDAVMPDISLLPPLANLFHVTTDYLLGMDTYQKDLRKAEFDEAFREYWKHDDKEKNYQIAVKAAEEYPGNMEYVEWLASAEYYVAFQKKKEEEYTEYLQKAVKHYKIVMENSADAALIGKAVFGIVCASSYLGNKQEAKEYALQCEDEGKCDELLMYCLEGDEKRALAQKIADRKLFEFIFSFQEVQKSVVVEEAVEGILNILFPDGNFGFWHDTLRYSHIRKAQCLCLEKRYDEAMDALKKARYHAEQMTKLNRQSTFCYTSEFFDLLQKEKPFTELETTDVDTFVDCLQNNACFDPVRERKDFQALLAR